MIFNRLLFLNKTARLHGNSIFAASSSQSFIVNNLSLHKHCYSSTISYRNSSICRRKKATNISTNICIQYSQRYASDSPMKNRLKKWMSDFVEISNAWVEKVSPDAKQYLDNFYQGIRSTATDIQTYRFVRKRLKVNPAACVSYSEEMSIFLLKRDALKVAPLIPLCLVPFGFMVLIFPIYFFPRYVLPHTFWTEFQRHKFYTQFHQERMRHYEVIMHHMNFHRENSSDPHDFHILDELSSVMQSRNVPSNRLLLKLRPLCSGYQHPLNLGERKDPVLLRSFTKVILASSFMPSMLLLSQLQSYAKLIIQLDQKLRTSNAFNKLTNKELQLATLLRGLDSANLPMEANLYWLKNWLDLTQSCNFNDIWFILHAMVLLSSNYDKIKFQRRVFG